MGLMGVEDGDERRQAPRSAEERIESLIAAAAAVAEEVGVDRLTTTLVAQWAEASIGTVYRYFPDRIGVIEGLRQRNAGILHDRMHTALAARVEDWDAVIAVIAQTLADAYREVPGFRAVTAHDWLDDAHSTTFACIDRLARVAVPLAQSSARGAVSTARLRDAVRILDALTRSAFGASGEGDAALLDLALRHARDELRSPVAGSQREPARLVGDLAG